MAENLPKKYVNEGRKYRILHATGWSKGDKIEVPTRLIVIEFTPAKKDMNFAVRWQNRDGATWGGSCYPTEEGAHNAFLRKYLDHNASFRKGNPSHLEGLVK